MYPNHFLVAHKEFPDPIKVGRPQSIMTIKPSKKVQEIKGGLVRLRKMFSLGTNGNKVFYLRKFETYNFF
jgi:hypothetical protein